MELIRSDVVIKELDVVLGCRMCDILDSSVEGPVDEVKTCIGGLAEYHFKTIGAWQ